MQIMNSLVISWHYIAGLATIGALAGLAAVGVLPGQDAIGPIMGIGGALVGGGLVNQANSPNKTA